jgi:antitoxin Phd
MSWPLGEAKNRFSEVVDRALREGPQEVTRHGEPVVVVVPIDQWRACQPGFKAALRALDLGELEIVRSDDAGRDVVLGEGE